MKASFLLTLRGRGRVVSGRQKRSSSLGMFCRGANLAAGCMVTWGEAVMGLLVLKTEQPPVPK